MIVGDAVSEYLSSVQRKRDPRTAAGYRQRLGVFASWCEAEGVSLERFSKKGAYRIIDDFVEHLQATHQGKHGLALSSTTVRGYVICIKMFFKWCLDDSDEFEECINPIALRRVEVPAIEGKIVETFSDEHIRGMLAACELGSTDFLRARNRAIVQVFLGTGIRLKELCTLTVSGVTLDPEDAHIKVFGKRRKWREVPLDEETRKAIGRYMRKFRAGAGEETTVFLNDERCLPLTRSGVEQLVEKLGRIAHVKGVRCSPHTFRHTYATRFMAAGGNPYHLQKFMGHTSFATTEKYLKTLPPRDIRAALRLVKR